MSEETKNITQQLPLDPPAEEIDSPVYPIVDVDTLRPIESESEVDTESIIPIQSDSVLETVIEQLIGEANPNENFISGTKIDSPATESITIPISPINISNGVISSTGNTEVISSTQNDAEPQLYEKIDMINNPLPSSITKNEDEMVVGLTDDKPAVENINEYQIVQGEREDGTVVTAETGVNPEMPKVISENYDYPEDIIKPTSAFRPGQSPDISDYALLDGGMGDMMYDDDHPANPSGGNVNNFNGYRTYTPNFQPDTPDYNSGADFMTNVDYADHSIKYNSPIGRFGGPMIPNDLPMYDTEPMYSDIPEPQNIVSGALDRNRPEPIIGMIPQQENVMTTKQNIDYQNNDDSIPFAQIMRNNQVIEIHPSNMNKIDDSSISEPANDILPVSDPQIQRISPSEIELYINLDFNNEKAYVNGKPFPITEASNLLSLVKKMRSMTSMRARNPMNKFGPENITPMREDFYSNMQMSDNPSYYFNEPSYYSPYYGQYLYYGPLYPLPEYPATNYYNDISSTNPFLIDLQQRIISSRMNAMKPSGDGYGLYADSPRIQRSISYPRMTDDYYTPYHSFW